MVSDLLLLFGILLFLIFSISKFKMHPFVALVLSSLILGIAFKMGGSKTVEVLLEGFGTTLRWISIIIIMGAFIGEVLQETGAANRIADKIVSWSGKKRLPWAMGATGYIISIPVFVDVAYILLRPVIESLSKKSNRPVLVLGLSLSAGLVVSHTFIPPTPGPMAMASLLGVEVGRMLVVNLLAAAFSMAGGIAWMIFLGDRASIPFDKQKPEEPVEVTISNVSVYTFLLDLLPILIPIILISGGSFINIEGSGIAGEMIEFVSIPVVAVMLGALIAATQYKRKKKEGTLNELVEQAIYKSAQVIMITGAGGALGFVIKETGIPDQLLSAFEVAPSLGILLPFAIAAALTTSTGSITVSLVGTASLIGPVVQSLPISAELVAASIASGSLFILHANSSFFWLLNKLHDAPPRKLYQTFTLQSLIMSLFGLVGVFILRLVGF